MSMEIKTRIPTPRIATLPNPAPSHCQSRIPRMPTDRFLGLQSHPVRTARRERAGRARPERRGRGRTNRAGVTWSQSALADARGEPAASRITLAVRTLCLVLIGLFMAGPAEASDPIPVSALPLPPLFSVERGEYVGRDARTGLELWRVQWTLEKEAHDGRTIVRVKEDGAGQRWGSAPTIWTLRTELSLSRRDGRLVSTEDVRNLSGRLLETRRREFDYGAGSGQVITTDLRTRRTASRRFPLGADSLGVEMLPIQLRVLPATDSAGMRFHLVTREGKVVAMATQIVGRERVSVPAGTFESYKIELEITGILGWAANLVLPKMYLWHAVAPPHVWIKYQGPDGGPGSREVVRELVSFEPRK